MNLLEQLIAIPSPPDDELAIRDFIIGHLQKNAHSFRSVPKLIYGEDFQNCLVVVFGKPMVAVFAHIDTVAYMAGYTNNLLEMGSPSGKIGTLLNGRD